MKLTRLRDKGSVLLLELEKKGGLLDALFPSNVTHVMDQIFFPAVIKEVLRVSTGNQVPTFLYLSSCPPRNVEK